MKTALFNLHEITVDGQSVLIEFYAGDIFDIYSDILLLSAFKGKYVPVPGTTWGSLHNRTGITVCNEEVRYSKISENLIHFDTPENDCFSELAAFELSDLKQPKRFTIGTLKRRYRELVNFLENHPTENEESISLPLLGTGNQGLSLTDSVSELLKTFSKLKKTKLKIIRVFANDFESIGVLNQKINESLKRTEIVHTSLIKEAMNEARKMLRGRITPLSFDTITDLISLNDFNHSSFYSFGLKGRIYAERVCDELLKMYAIDLEPSTLHAKISGLSASLRQDRPPVESHLRLLQTYGNQVAHGLGTELDDRDAASIVISIIKVVDFCEYKQNGGLNQVNSKKPVNLCR